MGCLSLNVNFKNEEKMRENHLLRQIEMNLHSEKLDGNAARLTGTID